MFDRTILAFDRIPDRTSKKCLKKWQKLQNYISVVAILARVHYVGKYGGQILPNYLIMYQVIG